MYNTSQLEDDMLGFGQAEIVILTALLIGVVLLLRRVLMRSHSHKE